MNELIVSNHKDGLRIGLLENKRIVELHHEKLDKLFSVGDIYLGKVKKLTPGLNAAFVDIGHSKDCFLHYSDLGPQVNSLQKFARIAMTRSGEGPADIEMFRPLPDIVKNGKMASVLKPNQRIVVQLIKEAISTKGPRLSGEISIPGQFMILVPFSQEVSVSRKIRTESEKKRLRILAESLKPKNIGVILRTAASGKSLHELEADMDELLGKWKNMLVQLKSAKSIQKVHSEDNKTTSILRDMIGVGFDRILTDSEDVHNKIKEYLEKRSPDSVNKLKLFTGRVPLFEHLGIEKQLKASFGKTVTMRKGSYLVIEHTEALHVVDVNSGSKNLKGDTLEENALNTNIEAANEIARQLRLRDMGGIIVIDFIDMKSIANKKAVFAAVRDAMKGDKAKHSILPLSKFGLLQITRQRVRPEINITTAELCPSCFGSGKIQPSILISDQIERNIDFLFKQNKEKQITLFVNPYVAAFLNKGLISLKWQWIWKHKKKIKIVTDNSLGFTEVRYLNSSGEEMSLQ